MFGQSNSIEQGTAPTHKSKQEDYAARRRAASAAWNPPGGDVSDGWEKSSKATVTIQERSAGLRQRRATVADTQKADAVAEKHHLHAVDTWRARVYYADHQQKSELMRASSTKISAKDSNEQTIGIMLDLAQSRGWANVKVKGSEEFKREVWVQATARGMETEGYAPKPADVQRVVERKVAASVKPAAEITPVKVEIAAPEPAAASPRANQRQVAKLKDSMAQIDNFHQSDTGRAQHRRDMKDAESVPTVVYARGPEGKAIGEAYAREHRAEYGAEAQAGAVAAEKSAQARSVSVDANRASSDARALGTKTAMTEKPTASARAEAAYGSWPPPDGASPADRAKAANAVIAQATADASTAKRAGKSEARDPWADYEAAGAAAMRANASQAAAQRPSQSQKAS